jgi:hypothetical protein
MIYQFPMSLFTCASPSWKKLLNELSGLPLYQMVQFDPNYLILSFNGELTLEQITTIEQCICTHTSILTPSHNKFYTITPKSQSTSSSSWEKIAVFKHDLDTAINYIETISYSKNSYDIKVEDSRGNLVTQKLKLTNTEMQVIVLEKISQPTTNICILYMQTTGTANIDSIIIYI